MRDQWVQLQSAMRLTTVQVECDPDDGEMRCHQRKAHNPQPAPAGEAITNKLPNANKHLIQCALPVPIHELNDTMWGLSHPHPRISTPLQDTGEKPIGIRPVGPEQEITGLSEGLPVSGQIDLLRLEKRLCRHPLEFRV